MAEENGHDYSQCPVALEWEEHRTEARKAMREVGEMKSALSEIHKDLKHLQHLPEMSATLSTMQESLLSAATSPKRIDFGMVAALGILGILVVILVLKDSDKSFEATKDGFKLRNQPSVE